MELTLTRPAGSQVAATCNGQPSHTFDLHILIPNNEKGPPHPLDDPVTYGKAIYAALFPPATPARRALKNAPERIILVTTDNNLDAILWNYAYGLYSSKASEGFLLECLFVRGLLAKQRIALPTPYNGLHTVAVPSNLSGHELGPLNIGDRWMRIKETIIPVHTALPTRERVFQLVVYQQNRNIHFEGHGGQGEKEEAILYFEQNNSDLYRITAKDFLRSVPENIFLMTLKACICVSPETIFFSNLSAALVHLKTAYSLGICLIILGYIARFIPRMLYSKQAQSIAVKETVFLKWLALTKNSSLCWIIHISILTGALYGLTCQASCFISITCTQAIKQGQAHLGALMTEDFLNRPLQAKLIL